MVLERFASWISVERDVVTYPWVLLMLELFGLRRSRSVGSWNKMARQEYSVLIESRIGVHTYKRCGSDKGLSLPVLFRHYILQVINKSTTISPSIAPYLLIVQRSLAAH